MNCESDICQNICVPVPWARLTCNEKPTIEIMKNDLDPSAETGLSLLCGDADDPAFSQGLLYCVGHVCLLSVRA